MEYRMKNAILFTSIFIATCPSTQGFVLDNTSIKERSFCSLAQKKVTPFDESRQRGKCEEFAQSVGQVMILSQKIKLSESGEHFTFPSSETQKVHTLRSPLSESEERVLLQSGTGSLIKQNIVLTAAHVVEDCLNDPTNCQFVFNTPTINFASNFEEVFIPKAYLEAAKELKVLDEKLKEKQDSPEWVKEAINESINHFSKQKANNDIALVRLKRPCKSQVFFLPMREQSININLEKEAAFAFGVSVNQIKDNTTGKALFKEYERHIAVIKLENEVQQDNLITSKFYVPMDYQPQCELDNLEKQKKYTTRFQYNPKNDPFLKGIAQPGDSGGPIIGKFKSSYQIIGVAQRIKSYKCSSSEGYSPGDSFLNQWTPISTHWNWIQETLVLIQGNQ